MREEKRCVATSADSCYFPALMALLRSLERTNPRIPIVVFDGGLTKRQRRKAARFARVVEREPFMRIKGKGKFSYIGDTTLLKFETATLDEDKVLYLDADMVVLENIDRLFDIPKGKVGVVPEVTALKNMFRPRHREMLVKNMELDWDSPGFNAGLFTIRPSEWPDMAMKGKDLVSCFGEEVFSKTKDQQLLNIIFRRKTHPFDRRYNFSPFYDEGTASPAIIHYLAEPKPWHAGYPVGKRYCEFRKHVSAWDHPGIILSDIFMKARELKGRLTVQ